MDVIALIGDANRGKSETLNIVYQLMLLFGYTQVPSQFRQLGNPVQKDFIDILEKKGDRIGIVTMGDYAPPSPDNLRDLLRALQNAGCKKAVCASRPGKIATSINEFSPLLINKVICPEPQHRIINGEDAERLYKMI